MTPCSVTGVPDGAGARTVSELSVFISTPEDSSGLYIINTKMID
jgi:hypothetical protein